VRELANIIERAIVLGSGSTIEREDLPTIVASGSPSVGATLSYRAGINAMRKEMIMNALAKTSGNRSAAARLLELDLRYLLRLMKSIGIE
jgi:two-component system response regulator PilR (NtrC family)